MRNYALDELNKSLENSKKLYEEDWSSYSYNTGLKISKEGDFKKAFEDTELAMIAGYSNMESYRSVFDTAVSSMLSRLTAAFSNWEISVKDTFELVGQDFDNFSKTGGPLDTRINAVTTKLSTVGQEFAEWATYAKSGFESLTSAANAEYSSFEEELNKYNTLIGTITTALTKMFNLAGIEIP
jgi:hypothetical protein